MISKISLTFGTKQLLLSIKQSYPERQMLLLAKATTDDQLALLDVSGKPSVFYSPIYYDIKLHRSPIEWQSFFNFMYFDNLSSEDQKIFNAKSSQFINEHFQPESMHAVYIMKEEKKPSNNVIFSIWNSEDDFLIWKKITGFTPLFYFTDLFNNFHESSYYLIRT